MNKILGKLGKVNYVPVVNTHLLLPCFQKNKERYFVDDKRVTCITKDSVIKAKKYLINPYHALEYDEIDKEILNEDRVVFSDSGGLQEINLGKVKYDVDKIFNWQQKNSNIGFCYDVIPFISGGNRFTGWRFDEKNFVKCAEKTLINIDRANKIRTNYDDFLYYGIIQGRKINEFKEWFDIIKKGNLDGYCVKTANNNPLTLAQTCCFALENLSDTPIHFLGIGNLSKSIPLIYLSNFLKNKISFDSSSYDVGTQFRTYIHPSLITNKLRIMKEENVFNKDFNFDNLNFCDCDVCRLFNENKLNLKSMINENNYMLGQLISLHNYNVYQKHINFIEKCGKNRNRIENYTMKIFSNSTNDKIIQSLDIIDTCNTNGLEYTQKKYFNKEKYNTINQTKTTLNQKNLFGF